MRIRVDASCREERPSVAGERDAEAVGDRRFDDADDRHLERRWPTTSRVVTSDFDAPTRSARAC